MSRGTSNGWGPPRSVPSVDDGDVFVPEPLALPSRDSREGRLRRPRLPARVPSFLPAALTSRVPSGLGPAVEALPGLARITAATALHTAEWGVTAYARTGRKILRAMSDPEAAADLNRELNEAAALVGHLARAVSSGVPLPEAVAQLRLAADTPPVPEDGGASRRDSDEQRLRTKGAQLLQQSRDVWHSDAGHPAYERILGDLAPDEARMLVLLLKDGPQPAVDVRTGGPMGRVNSQLVARGLTMVAARAGLRHVDLVPQYLNNLSRLGLVWQSSESLDDLTRYQVLEAQPDVLAATHAVKFARIMRRSLHLTPFGVDFARTCFTTEQEAEVGVFPTHETPPEAATPEPSLPRKG